MDGEGGCLYTQVVVTYMYVYIYIVNHAIALIHSSASSSPWLNLNYSP